MEDKKKDINFLLVVPKYVEKGQIYDFYFGLAIISACMKQHGYNVFCLNPNHHTDSFEQQLSYSINKNQIDVVCTGGMSVHYNEINKVLITAKKIKPDIITIVGGVIITSNPKVTCWGLKQIDYGIVGEGEETIIELADAIIFKKDVNSIKGLAYFNKENEYIITENRIPVANLDNIPFPDYEGFEYDEYIKLFYPSENHFFSITDEVRAGYIMASRSCPFACTFCYHHPNSKYRQRSLENVFQEIDYLVEKYDINYLSISDELFSFHKKRMYDFASRIKKYNLKWWTSFRVSDVDKEVLETLKDSGMFMVSYGIESMSDKILKSMKKHITRAQIENALKLSYEARLNIQGNIILGDPEETEATVKESVDWLVAHPEYGINLIMIRTYPFSPIYKYAISNGLIKDEFEHMVNNFPLINLTKMTNKKYQEISIFAENFADETQHFIGGEVVGSKITSLTHEKENVYALEIKCSSCNKISEYRNMVQKSFRTYFKVICRNCHIHLQIENIKAYHKNYTIYDRFLSIIMKNLKSRVNKNHFVNYIYYGVKKLKQHKLISVPEKYV